MTNEQTPKLIRSLQHSPQIKLIYIYIIYFAHTRLKLEDEIAPRLIRTGEYTLQGGRDVHIVPNGVVNARLDFSEAAKGKLKSQLQTMETWKRGIQLTVRELKTTIANGREKIVAAELSATSSQKIAVRVEKAAEMSMAQHIDAENKLKLKYESKLQTMGKWKLGMQAVVRELKSDVSNAHHRWQYRTKFDFALRPFDMFPI